MLKGSIRLFAAIAVTGLLTLPARALEVQPGLWQDTETGETNGKKDPPKVTTDCIKPEDAKDIVKNAQAQMKESMKDQAQQCSKLNIQENGNAVLFEMKCGDPKQGAIDMIMTLTVHSPQHTSTIGKSTMTFMGQKMVSTMTTDSKWVAKDCKK